MATTSKIVGLAGGTGPESTIDYYKQILGGTELPLLLTASDIDGVPCVDTTAVHVREIVAELAR